MKRRTTVIIFLAVCWCYWFEFWHSNNSNLSVAYPKVNGRRMRIDIYTAYCRGNLSSRTSRCLSPGCWFSIDSWNFIWLRFYLWISGNLKIKFSCSLLGALSRQNANLIFMFIGFHCTVNSCSYCILIQVRFFFN